MSSEFWMNIDLELALKRLDEELAAIGNSRDDRHKYDVEDLVWLTPSGEELEIAKKYAIKQDPFETPEAFVNAVIKALKNTL